MAPGSGRTALVGRHGAGWRLRVAAPAERGAANDAVVALLAETLGLRRRDVSIVAGRTGRDKVVRVAGIEPAELTRRLEAAARSGAEAPS